MTLDQSPEFCLDPLIYGYLLESGHTPCDPPGGAIFVPRAII